MSKHSPEPCDNLSFEIYDVEDNVIADCCYYEDVLGKHQCKANAARIVACVNACAGMEDPKSEIERLKDEHARMLNVIRVMQEATANEPTWINTNRVLSDILKDCTHA